MSGQRIYEGAHYLVCKLRRSISTSLKEPAMQPKRICMAGSFFRVDITSKDDESSRFATDFKADFVFVVK